MKKRILFPCLLLCLLLAACGDKGRDAESAASPTAVAPITPSPTEAATGSPDNGESPAGLSELLFSRDAVAEVDVRTPSRTSGYVRVFTSEEEKTQILDILYGVDTSGFTDADATGVLGGSVVLGLQTPDDEKTLTLISYNDELYLVIEDLAGGELCRKGPGDAIAFTGLAALVSDVLSNDSDPDYCAVVTNTGTGQQTTVNKGNSALIADILDKAAAEGGSEGSEAAASYDLVLELGGTEYGLNSETGDCYKASGGGTLYAQADSGALRQVLIMIGDPSVAPAT